MAFPFSHWSERQGEKESTGVIERKYRTVWAEFWELEGSKQARGLYDRRNLGCSEVQ